MNIVKKVLPIAGLIILTILTVCFRSIPKGKSWNDYKILFVKTSTIKSGTNIDSILKSCGIMETVSLNGQRAPIMLSGDSIEETMFKISISNAENRYLFDRQNYFFDINGEYQLYYIPDTYENNINEALTQLNRIGCEAGVDSTLAYLWLLPAVVIVLSIILIICSKNKLFMTITCIPACVYVFCNAFYASAIAATILILSLFCYSNILGRKGDIKKLAHRYILILIALGISITSAFSVSFISGFFYIICIAGTYCSVIIAKNFKNKIYSRYNFQPVFIRKATEVPVYGGKQNVILPVMLVAAVIIIAYFALGSLNIISSKSKAKLKLPGKTQVQDSKLPCFEDFYRWNWNVITSPYKSLNSNGEYNDNAVVFPRFVEQDGVIKQQNATIYYDDTFKQKIYDGIDNLDFNSIESVIKVQGDNFSAGYTDSASYNVSIFSIIMMIMCFSMLLFIYFSAIIGKGGRK